LAISTALVDLIGEFGNVQHSAVAAGGHLLAEYAGSAN
jgi:hypothetical protein